MDNLMRLQLPIGQWVDLDGKLFRFVRRGRDRERRLILDGVDGVPVDLSDSELLALQCGPERRLKLLLASEASDRLEAAGKVRVSLDRVSPELCDETRRRLEYVQAWERAGCPPRTEASLRPVVRGFSEQRREEQVTPAEVKPPSPRQVLRWIADWVASGGDVEALVPQTANQGNTGDRLHPRARQLLEKTVEEHYLVDTGPPVTAVHEYTQQTGLPACPGRRASCRVHFPREHVLGREDARFIDGRALRLER